VCIAKKVDLHRERLRDQNITITTRLVDTVSTPMLLKVVRSNKINTKQPITPLQVRPDS
jgi:alcohol dehydrogenase